MGRLDTYATIPSSSAQNTPVANYEHLLFNVQLNSYDQYDILETYASLRSLFIQLKERNPENLESTIFNKSWAMTLVSEGYQHIRKHSSIKTIDISDEDSDIPENFTDRDGEIGSILRAMLEKEGLLSIQETDRDVIIRHRKGKIKPATKVIEIKKQVAELIQSSPIPAIRTQDPFY